MDHAEVARGYYRRVDGGAYEALGALLTQSFVHDRPDRTLESRVRFLEFMREERPNRETSHVVQTVFEGEGRVAVEGRLETHAGDRLFGFVDVFDFDGDRIGHLTTYTD